MNLKQLHNSTLKVYCHTRDNQDHSHFSKVKKKKTAKPSRFSLLQTDLQASHSTPEQQARNSSNQLTNNQADKGQQTKQAAQGIEWHRWHGKQVAPSKPGLWRVSTACISDQSDRLQSQGSSRHRQVSKEQAARTDALRHTSPNQSRGFSLAEHHTGHSVAAGGSTQSKRSCSLFPEVAHPAGTSQLTAPVTGRPGHAGALGRRSDSTSTPS